MASCNCERVLTDAQWAALKPLVVAVRPRGKTPHKGLRRTLEAIIWEKACCMEAVGDFAGWVGVGRLLFRCNCPGCL